MKLILRPVSIILALLMLASVMSFTALAEETDTDAPAQSEDDTANEESLILSLDNLADTTNAVANDYKVTGTNFGGTVPVGDAVCDPNSAAGWKYGVYHTNIPLRVDSKYTVTFEAKLDVTCSNVLLAFANADKGTGSRANASAQGIRLNATNASVSYRMEGGSTYDGQSVSHGITNLREYHKYTVIIDGTDIIFMVDGNYIATFSVANPENIASHVNHVGGKPFVGDTLTLGALARPTVEATDTATAEDGTTVYPLMSFKNIKIYDEVVGLEPVEITFENGDGSVISTVLVGKGQRYSFPEVAEKANRTLVWKQKGYNVVLEPTMRFVAQKTSTFVAYQYHNADVKVFGVQKSVDTVDGKCKLRFLATIQDLSAENAGFEIIARYTEDGVEKTKDLSSGVSKVYTSVNANEDGTIRSVSAAENGGTYIMAYAVNNVPTGGQIDFSYRAYVTVNGEKIYSSKNPSKVTLVDGEIVAHFTYDSLKDLLVTDKTNEADNALDVVEW